MSTQQPPKPPTPPAATQQQPSKHVAGVPVQQAKPKDPGIPANVPNGFPPRNVDGRMICPPGYVLRNDGLCYIDPQSTTQPQAQQAPATPVQQKMQPTAQQGPASPTSQPGSQQGAGNVGKPNIQ